MHATPVAGGREPYCVQPGRPPKQVKPTGDLLDTAIRDLRAAERAREKPKQGQGQKKGKNQ
jgi:hypothetical protein